MRSKKPKNFPRKQNLTINRQLNEYPHTKVTPFFLIKVRGQIHGFISRGHVSVREQKRKTGLFGQALAELELYERHLFAQGKFEVYKKEIIKGMRLQKNERKFARFIEKLDKPTHIEFWRLPNVAVSYMHKGYSLSAPSLEELQKYGLKDANNSKIITFLKKNRQKLEGKVLFLLTKPATF